jgi:hypothetical protein
MEVGEDFDRVLSELAKAKDTTKSEIIRRAVASYAYLDGQVRAGGNHKKVSITTEDDRVVKDVVLP